MLKDTQVNRRKRYIPFGAKKLRERKSCPRCGSLNIKKRAKTYDYTCDRCGWNGQAVKIIMA